MNDSGFWSMVKEEAFGRLNTVFPVPCPVRNQNRSGPVCGGSQQRQEQQQQQQWVGGSGSDRDLWGDGDNLPLTQGACEWPASLLQVFVCLFVCCCRGVGDHWWPWEGWQRGEALTVMSLVTGVSDQECHSTGTMHDARSHVFRRELRWGTCSTHRRTVCVWVCVCVCAHGTTLLSHCLCPSGDQRHC